MSLLKFCNVMIVSFNLLSIIANITLLMHTHSPPALILGSGELHVSTALSDTSFLSLHSLDPRAGSASAAA